MNEEKLDKLFEKIDEMVKSQHATNLSLVQKFTEQDGRIKALEKDVDGFKSKLWGLLVAALTSLGLHVPGWLKGH